MTKVHKVWYLQSYCDLKTKRSSIIVQWHVTRTSPTGVNVERVYHKYAITCCAVSTTTVTKHLTIRPHTYSCISTIPLSFLLVSSLSIVSKKHEWWEFTPNCLHSSRSITLCSSPPSNKFDANLWRCEIQTTHHSQWLWLGLRNPEEIKWSLDTFPRNLAETKPNGPERAGPQRVAVALCQLSSRLGPTCHPPRSTQSVRPPRPTRHASTTPHLTAETAAGPYETEGPTCQ